MRNLIIFFFLAVILNALIWIFLVPVWHTPDEQAHFSQVANIVERGRNPLGHEMDVTEETYISEQLLGTARDKFGNNKFTFHPEYKIEYTDSLIGKYEASIAVLTKSGSKQKFVYQEATRYPLLYYIPASWIYKFFYSEDIFTRVFLIRFWSLIFFVLNIGLVYKIGRLIFSKNQFTAILLAMLVGFAPMMVFSNIGVTSDSLANFIFTLFVYLCLRLILLKITIKDLMLLIISSYLAINTKIQFIIVLPTILLLFSFLILREIKNIKSKVLIICALFLAAVSIFVYLKNARFVPVLVTIDSLQQFQMQSFLKYTWEYTLPHTYREVLPWYWGVYDWLGVTYPRIVYRIINSILLLSIVGFVVWLVSVVRKKLWRDKNVQGIFFALGIAFLYFLAVSVYDWLSWYQSGFQLGVQGRYFFPLISIQMLISLIGIKQLFPPKILGILMIVFNFFGFYTVAATYYDISNVQRFLWQVSQYKPFFVKVPFNVIIFGIYILFLVLFLYRYITQPKNGKI